MYIERVDANDINFKQKKIQNQQQKEAASDSTMYIM